MNGFDLKADEFNGQILLQRPPFEIPPGRTCNCRTGRQRVMEVHDLVRRGVAALFPPPPAPQAPENVPLPVVPRSGRGERGVSGNDSSRSRSGNSNSNNIDGSGSSRSSSHNNSFRGRSSGNDSSGGSGHGNGNSFSSFSNTSGSSSVNNSSSSVENNNSNSFSRNHDSYSNDNFSSGDSYSSNSRRSGSFPGSSSYDSNIYESRNSFPRSSNHDASNSSSSNMNTYDSHINSNPHINSSSSSSNDFIVLMPPALRPHHLPLPMMADRYRALAQRQGLRVSAPEDEAALRQLWHEVVEGWTPRVVCKPFSVTSVLGFRPKARRWK